MVYMRHREGGIFDSRHRQYKNNMYFFIFSHGGKVIRHTYLTKREEQNRVAHRHHYRCARDLRGSFGGSSPLPSINSGGCFFYPSCLYLLLYTPPPAVLHISFYPHLMSSLAQQHLRIQKKEMKATIRKGKAASLPSRKRVKVGLPLNQTTLLFLNQEMK